MARTGLVRFLYNHNPFYLLSVCLLLYGLQTSIAEMGSLENYPWLLATILAGCSVVMALTSWLIVRLGQVWDDARSIIMVLLLLFFTLAVSFDQLCLVDLKLGLALLAFGFLFSIVLSGILKQALGIAIPWQYQLSFVCILLVSFMYPLVFPTQRYWFPNLRWHWLSYGFPWIAALSMLSLLPAIRLGAQAVKDNGTPWVWPFFPWAVFVLLVVGLCGRSWLLCLAFESANGMTSIFGAYFLMPILISAAVLVVEIGRTERSALAQQLGLGMAFLALPLSLPWLQSGTTFSTFLLKLTMDYGSPIWLASLVLILLYTISWLRGIDREGTWLKLALFASLFISRDTVGFQIPEQAWPAFALAILFGVRAVANQQSPSMLGFSGFAGLGGCMIASPTMPDGHALLIGAQIMLLGWLLTGLIFRDRFAEQLNVCSAISLSVLSIATMVSFALGAIRIEVTLIEGTLIALASILQWKWIGDRLFVYPAIFGAVTLFCCGIIHCVTLGPKETQQLTQYLTIAITCFALAVFISCLKAGLAKHTEREWCLLKQEFRRRFAPVKIVTKS